MIQEKTNGQFKLVQIRLETYQSLKQIQDLFSKNTCGGKISMDKVISNLIPKSKDEDK